MSVASFLNAEKDISNVNIYAQNLVTSVVTVKNGTKTITHGLDADNKYYIKDENGNNFLKFGTDGSLQDSSLTRYVTSFEVIKSGDFDIILIEHFPCESKEELHKRERYWIERINKVNKNIPTRTDKEYREDNKDKLKKYREDHKQEKKMYDEKYRENNKKYIKELNRKHREKNYDKLNGKHSCECGGSYALKHKSTHMKTKKHQEYVCKLI